MKNKYRLVSFEPKSITTVSEVTSHIQMTNIEQIVSGYYITILEVVFAGNSNGKRAIFTDQYNNTSGSDVIGYGEHCEPWNNLSIRLSFVGNCIFDTGKIYAHIYQNSGNNIYAEVSISLFLIYPL